MRNLCVERSRTYGFPRLKYPNPAWGEIIYHNNNVTPCRAPADT